MEKIKKFIPLIAGLALIGAAVFTYFRTGELVKNCTEKTTATVVDIHEEIDTSSEGLRYIYYPVVQYKAGDLTLENGSALAPTPPPTASTRPSTFYTTPPTPKSSSSPEKTKTSSGFSSAPSASFSSPPAFISSPKNNDYLRQSQAWQHQGRQIRKNRNGLSSLSSRPRPRRRS